jgi:Xaa-Pro aminopeptidase
MPHSAQIIAHKRIQQATKTVLEKLPYLLHSDDTEISIADKCHQLLCELGYPKTWYYDCPALVLLGSRSCLSISGKLYRPSQEKIGTMNVITVDLSPLDNDTWGDCSRSFTFEFGSFTATPKTLECKNALHFLQHLQQEMMAAIKPTTTFGQLFEWTNVRIRESGFVNLDYRNNVGHSIATTRENRQFIEANNQMPLGEASFFSFEPFIRLKGGKWGFKHEDIFYFNDDERLEIL